MDRLLAADAEAFRRAAQDDLRAARAALVRFKALPGASTPSAVLSAWDEVGACLDRTGGLAHLFHQVHPSAAVREAGAEAGRESQAFRSQLGLDQEAHGRLADLDAASLADPGERRLLERSLRDFRRAGVDRAPAERASIDALRQELVGLSQAFSRAIADDVRRIRLDSVEELAGLPADYIAAHPPGPDGSVTISTDPPDSQPFLKYARSRPRRLELQRALLSRAAPENLGRLQRLVAARHELARLLGYPHWAAYVTEDKMIRSDGAAEAFIARVSDLAAARAEEETAALRADAAGLDDHDGVLRDGDRSFLMERLRSARYGFDARDVRPYLPYAAVLAGVLDTLGRLYGVEVVPRPDLPAWHPDVAVYDLHEDGALLARFALDMHSRPDKFKHAAMFDLTTRELPRAVLACNLPRPSGEDPGLLDPSQVRTLFHEFGHLLHHLFAGRQRFTAFAGIATEWDFVEVPSQLFEEWGRDRGVLARFARHHATGAALPEQLVTAMRAAESCGRGLDVRQQMFYAAYSLECFRRDPRELDPLALVGELKPRFSPFAVEPDSSFPASFGHLDGYSALYYTYMWSLTLAKDCLSAFGDDLMDGEVARRFRREVLEPGGSRDAEDLLAGFLGRPPSLAAFSAWLEG